MGGIPPALQILGEICSNFFESTPHQAQSIEEMRDLRMLKAFFLKQYEGTKALGSPGLKTGSQRPCFSYKEFRNKKQMNFSQAIQKLNTLLSQKQPDKITRSWIAKNSPDVYRFIWKNIRAETGEIDWDKVTISLNRRFQKRWIYRKRLTKCQWEARFYENQKEFEKIKEEYKDRLYTFLSIGNQDDWKIRDQISIAFVKIAQKGNILAIREITNLLRFTIDFWIDHSYRIYNWRGYESEIQEQLEDCIRRYRFTGSFIGYLFKTLEYRGRGLHPLRAYSLDDQLFFGEKRRVENVVKDAETGETRIYRVGK